MSYIYPYNDAINLFVKGRISKNDAERQKRTAKKILCLLENQPGLILADEVGMGKTFVALAVALSVATSDKVKRPVVIMVPSTLKEKWPRDFEVFREKCLPEALSSSIHYGRAETGVDFLKLLDDEEENRKSIVFLTHGAMSRGLTDDSGVWIKLALIQRALYRRWDTDRLKKALYRVLGRLLRVTKFDRPGEIFWKKLLDSDTGKWLCILNRFGIGEKDDPVPKGVMDALREINVQSLYTEIQKIPQRESKNLGERIRETRSVLNKEIREVWVKCLASLHVQLPLLILDEAHHLKNPDTKLASLFQSKEAEEDAEELKGPLNGMFERMIFLTATPFQLGHYELCSILERFQGISWENSTAPAGGLARFQAELADLKTNLDQAQRAAVRLDHDWECLNEDDLVMNGQKLTSVHEWWPIVRTKQVGLTPASSLVIKFYEQTKQQMKNAETLLKKWVIRHIRPKSVPFNGDLIERRKCFAGKSMISENDECLTEGLKITGTSLLPFLLSARLVALNPETRPFFSEGLASSYEAFRNTRKHRQNIRPTDSDDDDGAFFNPEDDPTVEWYLHQLDKSLPPNDSSYYVQHPKVKATVDKVIDLWLQGEKVLVFCHYVATGKVLRQYISEAMRNKIRELGAIKIGCEPGEIMERLETIGTRFFDQDSRLRLATNKKVVRMIQTYHVLQTYEREILDIVRRYLRTPTFLVRYFPLEKTKLDELDYEAIFHVKDNSGFSLQELLTHFFDFLQNHCGEAERRSFVDALLSIQTGSFMSVDIAKAYTEDELQGEKSERLLPNVRLINGTTKQETRQKIMLTFNTPFYPDVLVTSSVMAEGVDLHLNCRYVIHHDLCWNPSTLEQRTGRVDRIGAKVEKCGKPIHVYLPFISETQDEKMYRVVMDRERWFKVVMGEKYKLDAKTTEKLASRIPFPEEAAEELMFNLSVREASTD
ncbi:ATP-dependent helicase HepA [Candidatus Brocadiaceae bacterium B188]|nr:DEAD/DEAH box helicase family protein [Candidatus Brocadia sapporoensis]QQR66929.1 MAG: DEAD/DEAH box helicase family protein [Candidatus Brocadia sp.]RZV57790.1 MAG: hypothetical protein EX330_07865 [Candidatus Brocadia sp. BROELEC01]TWU53921.1 ATP-dependent helicase HepA [Candidatus Brocadiaceae bacterium B188]